MSLPRPARLFCLLTLIALGCSGLRAEEMRGGSAFVKGLSGSLTADGRQLSKHESFDPAGKTIVSGPSGHSCLVFSNRMALVLDPDTTLVVKSFQQALPDGSARPTDDVELARSEIALKLERGGFALAQVKPRATSTLTIELPQCTLSGRVSAMHISLDTVPPEVAVLEGNLRMSRKSGRDLLVQSGQWLDLGMTSHLSQRDMLKSLDAVHESAVRDETDVAEGNYKLVFFTPSASGWDPQVRILKTATQNAAKNDFLIRN
jgi:hypothetical protein